MIKDVESNKYVLEADKSPDLGSMLSRDSGSRDLLFKVKFWDFFHNFWTEEAIDTSFFFFARSAETSRPTTQRTSMNNDNPKVGVAS